MIHFSNSDKGTNQGGGIDMIIANNSLETNKRVFSKMLAKSLHQIARIEFQKFQLLRGAHLPQKPLSMEHDADALLWSITLQYPRGKQSWNRP